MKQILLLLTLFIYTSLIAQTTSPELIGYWHNWNDPNAPSIPLNQIDSRYSIVDIAFAVPQVGTDYKMKFIPDQFSSATFLSHIQSLQSQGKKVIIQNRDHVVILESHTSWLALPRMGIFPG